MGPSISIQVDPGEDYSILQLYQLVQILRYLEIMECIQMDGVIVKDFVALSVNKMDAATDLLCGRRQNEIGCSKDGAWKCCECDLFEKQISSQGTND